VHSAYDRVGHKSEIIENAVAVVPKDVLDP
jgi:hypothetical protein